MNLTTYRKIITSSPFCELGDAMTARYNELLNDEDNTTNQETNPLGYITELIELN